MTGVSHIANNAVPGTTTEMKNRFVSDETDAQGFDRIILAVGSDDQKRIIQSLLASDFRRCGADVQIVPDGEDGRRLGSGGAVLRMLRSLPPEDMASKKILMINCGGESRRTPNYSFCTKALIPVGRDRTGKTQTCFSRILKNAALLSGTMEPGLLLCCIDIPLDMTDVAVRLTEDVSFCVEAPAAAGARHGVMAADKNGMLAAYYQKAPEETLLSHAADGNGNVALEAGWTYFSAATVSALAEAARRYRNEHGADPASNLYEDVIPLLAPATDRVRYLREDRNGLRPLLEARLKAGTMRVCTLRKPLLHYGTLSELLRHITEEQQNEHEDFYSALAEKTVSVGRGTLLDHAAIGGRSVIGSGCIVSDVELRDVTVPDNTSVFGFRLRDGRFVTAVAAVEADPRSAPQAADALWETARFYPAESFTDSFLRYSDPPEAAEGMRLADCLSQADPVAFTEWRNYLEDLLKAGRQPNTAYAGYRERLLASFRQENPPLERLACVRDSVSARLPVRINFSGTWTDCMPYCVKNGGAVVNAAVTVDGSLPIIIHARRIPERRIEFCNGENPDRTAVYDPHYSFAAYSDFSLHHAVMQAAGIGPETALADGIRLTVQVSGLVKGSGLGVSSILLFGCFSVLSDLCGLGYSEDDLLTKTFIAEQMMRTGGGWQDQGALIGGGVKTVSAPPGVPQRISVVQTEASPDFLRRLSDRMVLIPTGRRHFGRFIVTDVMHRYLTGETPSVFQEIKALNRPLTESVRNGDMALFADTVNAHSECLTRLSPFIYGDELLSLRQEIMRYADACCICGAGGGGYLWAVRKETVPSPELRRLLHADVKTATIR